MVDGYAESGWGMADGYADLDGLDALATAEPTLSGTVRQAREMEWEGVKILGIIAPR